MEGCNFNLLHDDQVPHRVRSRRSTWRLRVCTRVLHSNVGDGRSYVDNEHRRAAAGGRAR